MNDGSLNFANVALIGLGCSFLIFKQRTYMYLVKDLSKPMEHFRVSALQGHLVALGDHWDHPKIYIHNRPIQRHGAAAPRPNF